MAKGVFKEISKLNKIPHPKSRKTAQLTRKAIRSAHRDKVKNVNLMKQNLVGEKFMWFKERIKSVDEVTPEKVLELIESYLGRFDEELIQIQLKHTVGQRKGRQHASREDIIKMTKKRELNEFNTAGLEMPQLLNPKQLLMLMKWEGELRFLQNFKVVRYSRQFLENLAKKSRNGENEKSKMVDEEQEEVENEESTMADEELEEKEEQEQDQDLEKEEEAEKDKGQEKEEKEEVSESASAEILMDTN